MMPVIDPVRKRTRTLLLTSDERGKVRARLVGQADAVGTDYDYISAVGRLVLAHPERFGIDQVTIVRPEGHLDG